VADELQQCLVIDRAKVLASLASHPGPDLCPPRGRTLLSWPNRELLTLELDCTWLPVARSTMQCTCDTCLVTEAAVNKWRDECRRTCNAWNSLVWVVTIFFFLFFFQLFKVLLLALREAICQTRSEPLRWSCLCCWYSLSCNPWILNHWCC
jgi:hypothetical protein